MAARLCSTLAGVASPASTVNVSLSSRRNPPATTASASAKCCSPITFRASSSPATCQPATRRREMGCFRRQIARSSFDPLGLKSRGSRMAAVASANQLPPAQQQGEEMAMGAEVANEEAATWRTFVQLASPVLKLGLAIGVAVAAQTLTAGSSFAVTDLLTFRAEAKVAMDTVWVLICSYLVVFMNAGFALVESGMCRSKNAVNILAKNLIVFALAVFAFYLSGFGILFGDGNPFIGLKGFFLSGASLDNAPATLLGTAYTGPFSSLAETTIPISAKFFFQAAFAGTAATIVSGAVAERIKFFSFCVFSVLLVGLSYPITGHWIWGGGWLSQMGFFDFAGCTTVHSVGGWAALIGAAILGPRLGRYADHKTKEILMPPHNFSLATLGCLILWLGWFGFNPGSTMSVDAEAISHIAVTTNLGACAGAITAASLDFVKRGTGKTDLGMIINGVLAGLVAVTAACPWISGPSAAIIGAIGGALVVYCIDFFNAMKIDDPVGAVSVHLGCGIWGSLAVGLFCEGPGSIYASGPARGLLLGGGSEQLITQIAGILAVGGFTVAFSLLTWLAVKSIMGLRVTSEEELAGLDAEEHGQVAYVNLESSAVSIH